MVAASAKSAPSTPTGKMKKNPSETNLKGSPTKAAQPAAKRAASESPTKAKKALPSPVDDEDFKKTIEDMMEGKESAEEVRGLRGEKQRQLYSDMKERREVENQLKVGMKEVRKLREHLHYEKEQRRQVLSEIQVARQEKRQLDHMSSSVEMDHGTCHSQMQYCTMETDVIARQHTGLSAEKIALESQLQVHRRARTLLHQQSTMALRETKGLRQQSHAAKNEVLKLRKEFSLLETEVEHGTADLKKEHKEYANLHERLEECREHQTKLRMQASEKFAKARQLSTEVAEIEGDHKGLADSIKVAMADLRNMQGKLGKLRARKQRWTDKLRGLKIHKTILEENEDEAERGVPQLHNHVDVLEHRLHEQPSPREASPDSDASPKAGRGAQTGQAKAQAKGGAKSAAAPAGKNKAFTADEVDALVQKKVAEALAKAGKAGGGAKDGPVDKKEQAKLDKAAKEKEKQFQKELETMQERIKALVAENNTLKVATGESGSNKPNIEYTNDNPFGLPTDRQFVDDEGVTWDLESCDSTAPLYEGTADLSHLFGGERGHAIDNDNPYKLYKDASYADAEGVEWDLEKCDSEADTYTGEDVDLSHLFNGERGQALNALKNNPYSLYKDKTYTDAEGVEWDLEKCDSEAGTYNGEDVDLSHLFNGERGQALNASKNNPYSLYKDKSYKDEEGVEWDLEPADSEAGTYTGEDVDLSHLFNGERGQALNAGKNNPYGLYKDKFYKDEEGVDWDLEPCDSEVASYTGEDVDLSHLFGGKRGQALKP